LKYLLILTLLLNFLNAGSFKLKKWPSGENFSSYLVKHKIDSTKFYNQIAPDDIKYLSDIEAGINYFENESNGTLKELLIPLGEEMAIHVYKKDSDYIFDIVSISYKTIKDKISIKIENNCFLDIKKATNNPDLATYLKKIFKGYIDFKKLKKGDIVSIYYEQKSIGGLAWGEPKIKAAFIKRDDIQYFATLNNESYKIWTNNQNIKINTKKIYNYLTFTKPLKKLRITSKFTYKRWHPILHRYRPHLGVDFGAKKGTPIHAIASGKVVYAGWIRGYGRVVKISHKSGYLSLYAHQSKLLVRAGQRVKANQIIGKVGSSGISTGAHLHLGVYKNGKPINPLKVINKKVKIGNGFKIVKKVVKKSKNLYKELPRKEKKLYNTLSNLHNFKQNPYVWKKLDYINIKIKKEIKNADRIKLSSSKGNT